MFASILKRSGRGRCKHATNSLSIPKTKLGRCFEATSADSSSGGKIPCRYQHAISNEYRWYASYLKKATSTEMRAPGKRQKALFYLEMGQPVGKHIHVLHGCQLSLQMQKVLYDRKIPRTVVSDEKNKVKV